MNVLVTAGPTREYIDTVRFITNASSGKMGYACAAAAVAAGHDAILITGPVALTPPKGVETVRVVNVDDLRRELNVRFDACDALIMSAAVGDFTVEDPAETKIPRSGGPVTLVLLPTEDLLAGVAERRRDDQTLIAFAVEDTGDEEKAYREMTAKGCDFVVLNSPAAVAADASEACIIGREGIVLPWARRSKTALAKEIVKLLKRAT